MRPRRKLVTSVERDRYIGELRAGGVEEISARRPERYIDEFLRFCDEHFGIEESTQIKGEHVIEFARVQRKKALLRTTVHTKVSEVLRWLNWLSAVKTLLLNPADGLSASELAGRDGR